MANSNSSQSENNKSAIETIADVTREEYAEGYFFPSDDIDPKLKKGAWSRKWAEAIWSLFLRGSLMNSIDLINEMRWLRMYGAGAQPKQLYMDWLEAENGEGYLGTNWDIFSPMSKYKRIIQGRFESLEFDYVATAIDPTSTAEKEDAMWEAWYKSNFGKKQREIEAMIGLPPENQVEYIANSIEELEMFREMGGFKIKAEAEAEVVLEATDYLSDIKTIKRKVLNDLVDLNRAAFRDYYDPITKTCKYEYVDWENLIIDFSNETDFKDIRFWGYLKFDTINNVRAETGLSEDELLSMVKPWLGYFGNYGTQQFAKFQMNNYKTENGDIVYNMFRVPILICEWISTDAEYVTIKNGKRYPQEHGKVYNTDKKKTKIINRNRVYTCNWIVGSKYVYNDEVQMAGNVHKPTLSIHAIRLQGKSIVQTIIPNLDQIQLTKIRLESAIATAKPNGLSIEVGALENINFGDGNLSPLELIRIARQTGDVLYKATTHAGDRGTPMRPIEHSEGGVGGLFDECIKNFELNFNFISELTGIDRISAASPRGGEETATAVKASVASTNDALQPIFTSYIQVKEWAAQSVLPRIQRVVKRYPEVRKTYENIMGVAGAKILEIGEDVGYRNMGIKIEIKPTAEMKQNILNGAMQALKAGQDGATISVADWLFIVSLVDRGRLKQAQALISYRINEAYDKKMKMQEENMKLNAENANKTEMIKAQNEKEKLKFEADQEIRVEAAKALFKMETEKDADIRELQKQLIISTLSAPTESNTSNPKQQVA